tara:strand:- start:3772 stop:4140 length:369 start_codon:yes stop_codon:yes gene_type:complete
MSETMNEPEPIIEAVEVYHNDVYRIVYTLLYIDYDVADEEDEPQLDSSDCVRFYEITDHQVDGEEWSQIRTLAQYCPQNSSCSQAFMEYIQKEVENNKTQFPPLIKLCASSAWLIHSIKKVN